MATSTAGGDRIRSLDITRGVAVMGIFSVNVIGMAMIKIAYFYPPAFGFDALGDKLTWLANFFFIDGKLRSLFSIMFGASLMLVIDRAIRAGRSPFRAHYARMLVLMMFGLAHFFILWWGDILTHYAAVGMVVYWFKRLSARKLFIIAAIGFLVNAGMSAYFSYQGLQKYELVQSGNGTAEDVKKFKEGRARLFPDAKTIAKDKADHASIPAHFTSSVKDEGLLSPFDFGPLWLETMALMILGMAGYKSGFLTGEWDDRRYRKVAATTLGIGALVYGFFAWWAWSHNFEPPYAFGAYGGYTPLFRPVVAMGYAALAILLTRRAGPFSERLAAVGRTAFSNYIGCTIIGTFLFFGFAGDLYAELSRGEAWLFVPFVWALMLLWSKWWLDRYHYGPLEWAWRSLARGSIQPMRKGQPALGAPTGD